jgi:hypothetical protein
MRIVDSHDVVEKEQVDQSWFEVEGRSAKPGTPRTYICTNGSPPLGLARRRPVLTRSPHQSQVTLTQALVLAMWGI